MRKLPYHLFSVKRLVLIVVLFFSLVPSLAALGQSDAASVDVVEVSGVIDGMTADFIESTLGEVMAGGSEVVVIQLDSPGSAGVSAPRMDALIAAIDSSSVPVVVWVGPVPAEIRGDAHRILDAADFVFASSGARFVSDGDSVVEVAQDNLPGAVDQMVPTLQQVFQSVNGMPGDGDDVIESLTTNSDGETTTLPIVFHTPSYWSQFWHLATTPHAAFFFLVVGLSVVTFEFYAIGPGIAAATGVLSMLLGFYGLAVLPFRWWALALILLGWAGLTASHQRGGVVGLTAIGTVLMTVGGLTMNAGAPAITTSWPLVIAAVLAVLFFYLLAMPVVGRSRFSTPTLGAEGMIGREGRALGDMEPDGEVEIDGATWQAGSHREAGIRDGDRVRVSEVDGVFLEVEPVEQDE